MQLFLNEICNCSVSVVKSLLHYFSEMLLILQKQTSTYYFFRSIVSENTGKVKTIGKYCYESIMLSWTMAK